MHCPGFVGLKIQKRHQRNGDGTQIGRSVACTNKVITSQWGHVKMRFWKCVKKTWECVKMRFWECVINQWECVKMRSWECVINPWECVKMGFWECVKNPLECVKKKWECLRGVCKKKAMTFCSVSSVPIGDMAPVRCRYRHKIT